MKIKNLKRKTDSCQALENGQLHSDFYEERMALAAKMGPNRSGIRASQLLSQEIKKQVDLPIIQR